MEVSRGGVWNVLVLGAGPAGCAAALQARHDGLTVLVLESRMVDRRQPGETLHPGIEPLFDRLGVRTAVLQAGFPRHTGIWVAWEGTQPSFEAYGESDGVAWRGFQADRLRLRAALLDTAVRAGAEFVRGYAPTALLVRAGRVSGVIANGTEIEAHWTIDATGKDRWLARHLDLATMRRSPQILARYGWLASGRPGADCNPRLTATEHGWHWRAPLGQDRLAWVEATIGAVPPAPGIDVTWRLTEKSAGPGYFLVGDAGIVLDPASSHGVLRAIMTAMFAVSHISGAVRAGTTEAAAARHYRDWLRDWFETDRNAMLQLYRRHMSPSVRRRFADF